MSGDAAGAVADARYMRAALAIGARGLGRTAPNPSVGCVIVARDGAVIGRGRTGDRGRPHAEAAALEAARAAAPERLPGATAYVTLEPCAHHGRTPPCADALAKAGVARVVSALEDPDPRVCGEGHDRLRRSGVAVTVGVCAEEAAHSHAGHLLSRREGRPFLTLKLAASLDGRIATPTGESQWITGAEARRRAHLLRATHDAVMVGAGTACADDPRLTVRLEGLSDRRPVRIVLDSALRTPPDGQLARGVAEDGPVWILHAASAPEDARAALLARGVRLMETAATEGGQVDAADAMRRLAADGLTRVFCEGGGGLAASLLAAGLVDRLITATAGLVIGGDGVPAVAPMGLERLADAPTLRLTSSQAQPPEVWTDWRLG